MLKVVLEVAVKHKLYPQCKRLSYYNNNNNNNNNTACPKITIPKKANNFTGKRNYELLLTRLQTCGGSGFIPQRARALFFSIPAGKSRPAVTQSFLAPPHFPINLSVQKWKLLRTSDWLCKTYDLAGPCTRRNTRDCHRRGFLIRIIIKKIIYIYAEVY